MFYASYIANYVVVVYNSNYNVTQFHEQKKIRHFFLCTPYTYKLLLFPEVLEAAEDPEVFEMTVAGLAI